MLTPHMLIPAGLALATLAFFAFSGPIATALLIGLAVGYLLNPLVNLGIKCGLPRSLASFIPVGLFVGVLAFVIFAGAPLLAQEITTFIERAPAYREQLMSNLLPLIAPYMPADWTITSLVDRFGQYTGQIAKLTTSSLAHIAGGAAAVVDFLTLLVIIPIVAFFMLQQWPTITNHINATTPPTWRKTVARLWPEIDKRLAGFFRGQVLIGLFLAVFYGIGLAFTDLEIGWALGVLTGLLSIVPMLGGLIGMLTIGLVALLQFQFIELWPYLTILMVLASGSLIENFILSPLLLGKSVKLHPLWVLIALLAGGKIAGAVGVILAIPAVSVAHVVLPELITWWHKDLKKAR